MFVGAEVFDAVFHFGGRESQFATVAYWMTVVGLAGGVLAAVPGWIDWFAIPSGTRAETVGLAHGLGNGIGVLGPYGASWWLRRPDIGSPPDLALVLGLGGLLLAGVTAWLGGELVERLGIGVGPGGEPGRPELAQRQAGARPGLTVSGSGCRGTPTGTRSPSAAGARPSRR
jgi:uncharacterized membrane protein